MTKELEKLSVQELHTLAAEIVRTLDGAAQESAFGETRPSAPELLRAAYGGGPAAVQASVQRLLAQAAAALVSASDASDAEAAALSAPDAAERGASALPRARSEIGSRFEAAQLQTESALPPAELSQKTVDRRQDVAALSECFRRDSRRYDVGFERF